MECKFYVGQKVVCVNDKENSHQFHWVYGHRPYENEIYTVTRVGIDIDGDLCLAFQEISQIRPFGGVWGFLASRFRPLVSKGMEDLRANLKTAPRVKERERA